MQLTFKTVTKRQFNLDVEPTENISSVKQKIEENTEYSAAGMKLIYGGRELNDGETVEAAGIQSSIALIVVAKKKAHTQTKPKKEETTTSTTTEPTTTTTPAPTTTTTTTTPSTTPSATTGTTTAPQTTSLQGFPNGPGTTEYDEAVQCFLEMGYERKDIDECMKAAFYDRGLAADYLISGIPEEVKGMMQEEGVGLTQQQGTTTGQQGGGLPQGLEAGLGNQQGFSLRDLFNLSPQLNNLRNAIRQNPVLLREFLQHVSQVSPELYQIIQSNPREFLEIINEQPTTTQTGTTGGTTTGGTTATGGGQQEGNLPTPPPGTIYITQEDDRKINELVGLGFSKHEALEAYLACDRNQEMAANYLFESKDRFGGMEEEEDENQGGNQGGNQ
ncbi:hypothetical protein ABK040_014430 [Willaertia magna]